MEDRTARIMILGASGLIGHAVAEALVRDGLAVTAVARRFTPAQAISFGQDAVTCPVVDLAPAALAGLLSDTRIDIVFNCLGVLQDGPRGTTGDVHGGFVARLLDAIAAQDRPILLIHVSIPGRPVADKTAFSLTKRQAEGLVARSAIPFVILRPGFVIASGAYGGSALIRGLAALPFALPPAVAERPFASTAIADIVRTIAVVAQRWRGGERNWRALWDVLDDGPSTVGGVVDAFRRRLGGPEPMVRLPAWPLAAGAWAGDAAALFGWTPPVRTTALREMMRGVEGDPRAWMAGTGLSPTGLADTLAGLPSTIQERWFGRLFLLKPLVIAGLALFWSVSGLIALFAAFGPATAILTAHGFPLGLAQAITIGTSLADLSIGLAIAGSRTCRSGLRAGIALSLFYMASAAVITPELWIEPLGALVKTGPAIILMLVALAILDAR